MDAMERMRRVDLMIGKCLMGFLRRVVVMVGSD